MCRIDMQQHQLYIIFHADYMKPKMKLKSGPS